MFKLPQRLQMYTTPLQVKQHRQCTYNVAERRVWATIVAVEQQ